MEFGPIEPSTQYTYRFSCGLWLKMIVDVCIILLLEHENYFI